MTEIIKAGPKAVSTAAEVLARGGVIIYPTETLYGIGVDATNSEAMSKLIEMKKRKGEKTEQILVAYSDIAMAKKYLTITKEADILAKRFMPGPLSLVLRDKQGNRARLRIPERKITLGIIKKFGGPITSTSANISGEENIYKISDIIKKFGGKVDLIIDDGNIPRRKASTVFDMETMKILREGPISKKQIEDALKLV